MDTLLPIRFTKKLSIQADADPAAGTALERQCVSGQAPRCSTVPGQRLTACGARKATCANAFDVAKS